MYDRSYFEGHDYAGDWRRRAMKAQEAKRILDFLPPHQIGRVLDIGCGIGDFISEYFSWAELWGVDISDYARSESAKRGVNAVYDVKDTRGKFDLIVFRGTIQHLDEPLRVIRNCVARLSSGGMMVFLATPNSESLVFRLFGELPALDKPRNFVVFGRNELANILKNFGMKAWAHEPYIDTPYANPVSDLFMFALRLIGIKRPFAFWGNMMEVYAQFPTRESA